MVDRSNKNDRRVAQCLQPCEIHMRSPVRVAINQFEMPNVSNKQMTERLVYQNDAIKVERIYYIPL